MLEEDALASDVGPHFGNVPVGLGKMAANHRYRHSRLRKIKTPPRKVYLREAHHMLSWRWRLGPARFGSYKTPGGSGVLPWRVAYDASGLGSCDSRHRLLFE